MSKSKDPKVKKSPPRGAEALSKIDSVGAKTERPPVAIQHIPISRIKANPSNPRVMRDEKFAKLKKSLTDFPDMLNKRPIVGVTDTDGKIMVLGGNMRLRALQDLKAKEVPVMLADEWTEEQRREFTIKDNIGFGEWDLDALANEWDADKLGEWGMDLPKLDFEDANKEIDIEGMDGAMVIKLNYPEDEYHAVREALSKVASTPEQAVSKLLGLA